MSYRTRDRKQGIDWSRDKKQGTQDNIWKQGTGRTRGREKDIYCRIFKRQEETIS
jgi:hypothetical protein